MPFFGLILQGGGVDGDTSLFLFGGLVDFAVFYIFSSVLVGQILGDGGGQGGLAMVDMPDCTN